jgi:signal transduction histidine kinase
VKLPAAPDGQVRTHTALLGQLVDNLPDNACNYSAGAAPITVRVVEEAEAVILAVEDAGPGVAPEELPHVFEPFDRSAEAQRFGRAGVGLALAVAQRIATALGGTLKARNEPGQGARFLQELPQSRPER